MLLQRRQRSDWSQNDFSMHGRRMDGVDPRSPRSGEPQALEVEEYSANHQLQPPATGFVAQGSHVFQLLHNVWAYQEF